MRRSLPARIAVPLAMFALALPAAAAPAEPPGGATVTPPVSTDNTIIAVVNDYAISEYDLAQRVALFTATSGTQVTKDTLPRLRMQLLGTMEDEIMEQQEAAKHNVTVTNGEIDKAVRDIAAHNHLTPEQLVAMLTQAGVRVQTFTQYVAAQLIWQKLVIARYGTGIVADDQQLKDATDRYLSDLRRDGVVQMR